MARVRIMYWKEIPVQIQAEDKSGVETELLNERFQLGVDAISMIDGSSGNSEYIMGWEWGEFTEMSGSAKECLSKITEQFNRQFPLDFVTRIVTLLRLGHRDPRPGAIDDWVDQRY